VGVVPGRDRSLPPVLLGAHYDSVIDAPCVDDNSTSVALNLAIAEEYVLRPLERDLVIAFFDAEEPPFFLGDTMGSRRFCEDHCRDTRFVADVMEEIDRTPDAESGPSPCDPVDFEIRMFRRAAGPLLPLVLKYFDIVMPGSRAELDNLISGLINGKLPRSGS
jgi:hypothetical protein